MNRALIQRVLAIMLLGCLAVAGAAESQLPHGNGSYDEFVGLFQEFLEWRQATARPQVGLNLQTVDTQRDEMQGFHRRLADMSVSDWSRSQQVDYLAVRSRFDQHDFLLNVSRPWSRDPGYYIDRMLRVTFTHVPVRGEAQAGFLERLAAIPLLAEQAQSNLTEVAADYADLALLNLDHSDGVGHGYPYRAIAPAGVLGWYDDLLARVEQQQPELHAQVTEAKQAVERLRDWLAGNRDAMTGTAGVGRDAFDWYLHHVKLMPYTSADIVTLGERELQRLASAYALERHRNRDLPELEIAASAEDYAQRIEATDSNIRTFLVEKDIITIPDFVGELDTNVPWVVRPNGPNFWEQVQYRDPHPDHLHAVIPGHRFDILHERMSDHSVRTRIGSGARTEGWATYLEEAMMEAGLLDDRPRTRELILIFGIFRAARVPADVWLQSNEMTVDDAVTYWMEHTPFLDADVARVDAEIYLRRPPGYGLGYTIGALQMRQLLADRQRQLGDEFDLRQFHDEFMSMGRIPMSLVRWEMTGLDNEVRNLWNREPLALRLEKQQ